MSGPHKEEMITVAPESSYFSNEIFGVPGEALDTLIMMEKN